MTDRDRRIVAILVPLVLLAAFWFLLVSPKRKEIERLDGKVDQANVALAQAQSQLAQYQAAEHDLQANIRALARAGRAVPAGAGMPALLRQLEHTAQRSRVDLSVITRGDAGSDVTADPTASGVTQIGLSLHLDGDFFRVHDYLARLDRFIRVTRRQVEATGRLLSVSALQLGPGPSGFPRLSATVTATIYALPDIRTLIAQTPLGNAEAGAATLTDATPESSSSSPTPAATAQGVTP
jgi:Tfp pilus assembly protein PilO